VDQSRRDSNDDVEITQDVNPLQYQSSEDASEPQAYGNAIVAGKIDHLGRSLSSSAGAFIDNDGLHNYPELTQVCL